VYSERVDEGAGSLARPMGQAVFDLKIENVVRTSGCGCADGNTKL
jgi:hypothetical protein